MSWTRLLGNVLALHLGEKGVPMLSRSIAILFASFLPTAALILPLSPAHKISALVAGTLATLLAALSMAHDRARIGAVLIGAWVALTPFIFPSTLVEGALTVCWGTMMFVSLAGPFSAAPRRSWVASRQPAQEPMQEPTAERQLPIAA
jgi:hypothetical protein